MLDIRSFRDVLRLFFIFKSEFKIAFVSTIIVALLGAFLLPLKFESEARLLVKHGRENSIMSIDAGNRQPLIAPTTVRDPIIDEESMLTKPRIIKKVAEKYLVIMENSVPPEGLIKRFKHWIKGGVSVGLEYVRVVLVSIGLVDEKTLVERVADKLEKNFTVEHAAGSSVMQIVFTWDDPYVAQQIVQEWVDLYLIERSQVLSQSSTLYDFYDEARVESAEEMKGLQLQINSKLDELDIVDFSSVFKNLTIRLSELHENRFEAIHERASLQAGVKESSSLQKQLHLTKQLDRLKLDLTGQLRTFSDGSESISNLRKGIKDIEKKISIEVTRHARLDQESMVEELTLNESILVKRTKIKEMSVLILGYDQEIVDLSLKLEMLLSEKPSLLKLNAELLSAEKNYSLYLGNLEKARIDFELDKDRISNIAVIEAASFKPSRVFPKSLNIIFASVPVGLLVAILALYICYLLDQRIHDGGRIEKYFGVKFWTALNEISSKDTKKDSNFQANLYRIYSLLPLEILSKEGLIIGLASPGEDEGVGFVAEHLKVMLEDQGHAVVTGDEQVKLGQIRIIEAPALITNSSALVDLREANLRVLIVEAAATTIPTVEHSLAILQTAFGKVDGIILNRRKFEIPSKVLQYFTPKVG